MLYDLMFNFMTHMNEDYKYISKWFRAYNITYS